MWCFWPRLASSGNTGFEGLYRLTLRFRDPITEQAFARSKSRAVIAGVFMLSVVSAVVACLVLVFLLPIARTHMRSSFRTDLSYMLHGAQAICICALLVLTLFVSCLCRWRRLPLVITPTAMEVFAVGLACFIMGVSVLTMPGQLAKFCVTDLTTVFGAGRYASDSGFLMLIDGIVTGCHLALPVRWHIMLPLEVAAVALYAALVFIIGSDEPMENAIFNLMFLTSLVVCTGWGKRALEMSERHNFAKIIQEKQLRCEAEFKLSQAESRGDGALIVAPSEVGSEARPLSQVESMPASNLSGRIFEALTQDGADPGVQLACIAEMGRNEHWCISESEITMKPRDVLGSGGFGIVTKGVFCGTMVAIKTPREEVNRDTLKKLSNFANEIRVLRHLRHPNVVHMYGAVLNPNQLWIALVLEYVDGVTIDKFVMKRPQGAGNINESAQFQIIFGVCLALLYLHTRRPHIVHGDIKTDNIMVKVVGDQVTPKLLDFGLSRIITRSTRPLGGTLVWMAPEVLFRLGPTKCSADVYSFGGLIAYVATCTRLPMAGWNKNEIKRAHRLGIAPLPHWPEDCAFTPSCSGIAESCLQPDEQHRPSMKEVYARVRKVPRDLQCERLLVDILPALSIDDSSSVEPPNRQREQRDPEPRDQLAGDAALGVPPTLGAMPVLAEVAEEAGDLAEAVEVAPDVPPPQPLRFAHAERIRTSEDAMKATLVDLISKWNFEFPVDHCCPFHAGIHKSISISQELLGRSCYSGSWVSEGVQCLRCGVLGLDKPEDCEFCAFGRAGDASTVSGPRMQL